MLTAPCSGSTASCPQALLSRVLWLPRKCLARGWGLQGDGGQSTGLLNCGQYPVARRLISQCRGTCWLIQLFSGHCFVPAAGQQRCLGLELGRQAASWGAGVGRQVRGQKLLWKGRPRLPGPRARDSDDRQTVQGRFQTGDG